MGRGFGGLNDDDGRVPPFGSESITGTKCAKDKERAPTGNIIGHEAYKQAEPEEEEKEQRRSARKGGLNDDDDDDDDEVCLGVRLVLLSEDNCP